MSIAEKSCINCQFFCRIETVKREYGYDYYYHEIPEQHRNDFKKGKYQFDANPGCLQNLWDKNYFNNDYDKVSEAILDNRKETCFFWSYKPNTKPEGAIELQKRSQENKKFYRQLTISTGSTIAAAIALFVNLYK